MEIVIGVTESSQSEDAIALGLALCKSLEASPVIAHIHPALTDYPGPAHVDAEWRGFLRERTAETLAWAKSKVGDREDALYVQSGHRSSGTGLAKLADRRNAAVVVISSAPGVEDRITAGTTSDALFHSSPAPVAVAPLGYRRWAPERFRRVVLAYQRTAESDHALDLVVEAIQQYGVGPDAERLVLLNLIERVTRIYGSRLGRHAEDQVMRALHEQAEQALAHAAARLPADIGKVRTCVSAADTITGALSRFDWADTDVLVAGSAGGGRIGRVFLGDVTYRILRAATVPTVIVPRSSQLSRSGERRRRKSR